MLGSKLSARGAVLSVLLLTSCGETPTAQIEIVTGEESDVLSRDPAPSTLVTELISLDGTRAELSRVPLPTETVTLGDRPRTDIGALSVTAVDEAGKPLVRGETLFVQWGALEHSTLEVFVQRTGELARMPRGPNAFEATVATTVYGRFVLAANGTATMLYDLLALKTVSAPPELPRSAQSIASVGSLVLIVDEAGASVFDLTNGASYELPAPSEGSFADFAGGEPIVTWTGAQYIVGATRTTGEPTARVFALDASGTASTVNLSTPRKGACAAYVEGRGLVVIGGNATAAGAELLSPGATVATPLPFAPVDLEGCGAVALDATRVAVAGGRPDEPVRVFDVACTASCAPTTWADPIPLSKVSVAPLSADAIFVLGDDVDGATHAFRASTSGLREIPLRVPRRGARLVFTPTGALAIVGGGEGIEQYLD